MGRIIIDIEKCKSCGICLNVCPSKLISFSDATNNKGDIYAVFTDKENKCTGCTMCAISCPEIAIKEVLR